MEHLTPRDAEVSKRCVDRAAHAPLEGSVCGGTSRQPSASTGSACITMLTTCDGGALMSHTRSPMRSRSRISGSASSKRNKCSSFDASIAGVVAPGVDRRPRRIDGTMQQLQPPGERRCRRHA